MKMKEIMGILGLSRRAGKLCCGHDVVKETIVKSTAELVFLSVDASERLEREMTYACTYNGKNIPIIRTSYSMADFANSIGKGAGVFSVTDTGFAKKLHQQFMEESDDNKI